MPLTKEQKKKITEDLKEKIARQKAMIFVDFQGLKVRDLFDLRRKLKNSECQFIVAKKTLMKLAFQEKKIEAEPKKMEGQIALVFGFKNELSPSKIIYQFSQENKNLKILGGFIESQKDEFLNAEKIIILGQLPDREELLAKLVGIFSAPVSNLKNVLEGNIKGLLFALSAIKK